MVNELKLKGMLERYPPQLTPPTKTICPKKFFLKSVIF